MSDPTIAKWQDGWYWYDAHWEPHGPFETIEQAIYRQERASIIAKAGGWAPVVGDYVWWSRDYGASVRTPAQVVSPTMIESFDWDIRLLTGSQMVVGTSIYLLAPMTEMEVIALAVSWPDIVL